MNHQIRYLFILIIGVIFLSTSAIFVKIIEASSSAVAFYRLFISGLILLPLTCLNKDIKDELFSLSRKDYILVGLTGALLGAHYILWFESLRYTSVASSIALVSLQPVFALSISYLYLRQRINCYGFIGIVLSIVGAAYIGWQDFQLSGTALLGDVLALLAAVIITLYFFLGKHLRQRRGIVVYSLLGYWSSALFVLIYGISQQEAFWGYDSHTWLLFIAMAICSTIFGQLLINWVLKWIDPITVSVAILSEVIWATAMSTIILGEILNGRQFIGIVVIVLGQLLYAYRDRIEKIIERRKKDGESCNERQVGYDS